MCPLYVYVKVDSKQIAQEHNIVLNEIYPKLNTMFPLTVSIEGHIYKYKEGTIISLIYDIVNKECLLYHDSKYIFDFRSGFIYGGHDMTLYENILPLLYNLYPVMAEGTGMYMFHQTSDTYYFHDIYKNAWFICNDKNDIENHSKKILTNFENILRKIKIKLEKYNALRNINKCTDKIYTRMTIKLLCI